MQRQRVVREQAVDAEIEQGLHFLDTVDGPRVHLQAEPVCPLEESGVDSFERRLNDRWSITAKSRAFINTGDDALLGNFRNDSYVDLSVRRYF